VLISPSPEQEGNKLQRPNSGFIQHTPARSSTHFSARCSNFCKSLKTKIRRLSVQPGLRGTNDLCVRRKIATFQFFQSREQVVLRRGQIRRIGWVIKTLEAQTGQFLLSCKCPVSRDNVVQEKTLCLVFPSKCPSIVMPPEMVLRQNYTCLVKTL